MNLFKIVGKVGAITCCLSSLRDCLSVCLSVCVYLYVCLSVCLSLCLFQTLCAHAFSMRAYTCNSFVRRGSLISYTEEGLSPKLLVKQLLFHTFKGLLSLVFSLSSWCRASCVFCSLLLIFLSALTIL